MSFRKILSFIPLSFGEIAQKISLAYGTDDTASTGAVSASTGCTSLVVVVVGMMEEVVSAPLLGVLQLQPTVILLVELHSRAALCFC